MNQTICVAIRERKVVSLRYSGGLRSVEPHCHGISTAGNEVLRGYQIGGHSQSGIRVGWKLFDVSMMSGKREPKGHPRESDNLQIGTGSSA